MHKSKIKYGMYNVPQVMEGEQFCDVNVGHRKKPFDLIYNYLPLQ